MKSWIAISMIVVAATLGAADTGCGGPTVEMQTGMVAVGDVTVVYDGLGGVHTYGSTSCPQPVGSFVLTNNGTAPAMVDVSESSTQLDVYLYDPETDTEVRWTGQTIPAGGSVEAHLRFNCSSTADISTTITVAVSGGSTGSSTLQFQLDVQGAP